MKTTRKATVVSAIALLLLFTGQAPANGRPQVGCDGTIEQPDVEHGELSVTIPAGGSTIVISS